LWYWLHKDLKEDQSRAEPGVLSVVDRVSEGS